jgi:hypothetical protein
MSQPPYIRPEFERELAPLRDLPVETPLPLGQRYGIRHGYASRLFCCWCWHYGSWRRG